MKNWKWLNVQRKIKPAGILYWMLDVTLTISVQFQILKKCMFVDQVIDEFSETE